MATVGLVIDRTDPKEDGFSPPNQRIDQSPTPSPSYCCLEKFPHIFDMTLRAAVSATLWHSPWRRTLKINCYHSTIRNPKHLSHAWASSKHWLHTDCACQPGERTRTRPRPRPRPTHRVFPLFLEIASETTLPLPISVSGMVRSVCKREKDLSLEMTIQEKAVSTLTHLVQRIHGKDGSMTCTQGRQEKKERFL